MERIVEHIEFLLLQHDCVIIPDFGGFVLQTIPAEYLEEGHLFTPSRKEIIFNPTLTHNDGLLAESYMQRYTLDFAKAQSLVRNDVAEMKGVLDEYSELQLGSIGLFFKEEGRLIFMPAKHSDELFSVYSYGLPVYNYLPLTARDSFDMRSFLTSEPVKKSETEKNTHRGENVIYSIPVTRTFLRIVAASAAAILLYFIPPTSVNDVNKDSYPASFDPREIMPKKTAEEISMGAFMKNEVMYVENTEMSESLAVTPSETDNSVTTSSDSPNTTTASSTPATDSPNTTFLPTPATDSPNTTPATDSPNTTTVSPTPATGSPASSAGTIGGKKYYVIIGSFNTKSQAQRHINSLKGIDTAKTGILVRDRHIRVYAEVFSTLNEAKIYQTKIPQESWIYTGQ